MWPVALGLANRRSEYPPGATTAPFLGRADIVGRGRAERYLLQAAGAINQGRLGGRKLRHLRPKHSSAMFDSFTDELQKIAHFGESPNFMPGSPPDKTNILRDLLNAMVMGEFLPDEPSTHQLAQDKLLYGTEEDQVNRSHQIQAAMSQNLLRDQQLAHTMSAMGGPITRAV